MCPANVAYSPSFPPHMEQTDHCTTSTQKLLPPSYDLLHSRPTMTTYLTSIIAAGIGFAGLSSCVSVDSYPDHPNRTPHHHHGYKKVIVRGVVYYSKDDKYYQHRNNRYVSVRNPYAVVRPTPDLTPSSSSTPNRDSSPRPPKTDPSPKPVQPIKPKPDPSLPFKPKPLPPTPPAIQPTR